ncbi:hypothetical protein [Kitasatospora viridis]|uniref:Uncharacterized protein n=1 Tax=Kitasatospora viridis TaxID=281105 RepID=A0A561SER2_9ACTN|nr:hypothetical protein [Kitasatospora viridis]TWF73327.1 hypothetical protein FHX73_16478 [Kitasatospora viridis]
MSESWPGLAGDGAELAALGLLRIAADGLATGGARGGGARAGRGQDGQEQDRREQDWRCRAEEYLKAWSGDGPQAAEAAAVAVALALATRQAALVMELHHGDADGARAWLGERSAAAGEGARSAGEARPVVPVVMAMVWFGIDAIAASAPGPSAVCVLDPERALRVVERCEAFLRRAEDHSALVLSAAETTAAVLARRTGRGRRQLRAWLDAQADGLLRAPGDADRSGHDTPWWVPEHPGGIR